MVKSRLTGNPSRSFLISTLWIFPGVSLVLKWSLRLLELLLAPIRPQHI